MKNMNGVNAGLIAQLPSGAWWSEEKPAFTQQSTQSYGSDFGSAVLNIKIDGSVLNLKNAIAYIVGYSQCISSTTGQPFDPNLADNQSPFYLSRKIPAIHPIYSGLYATKILSITGMGNWDIPNRGALIKGSGVAGEWRYAIISILFEIPKYPIMTDQQNAILDSSGNIVIRLPEYLRYTEFLPEENYETLARKGQKWSFLSPETRQGGNIVKTYNGDRLLRQPKGALKIITYDVHQDYVMLGRLVPTNGLKRLSTLNALPFPLVAYRNQNEAADAALGSGPEYAQYQPGTLLLMPSKYPPHAQCHPAVLDAGGQPLMLSYFPRTVDVERNFLFFDPPSRDTVTVNLANIPGVANGPYVLQAAATLVRGHNLAPLVEPLKVGPLAGQTWFTAVNIQPPQSVLNINPTVPLPSDQVLTYPYSNFEGLWQPAESF